MSSVEPPPPPAVPPPPPPQRHGCATAFMVLFGVGIMADQHPDPSTISLVVLGLLVGFAGIMLIREAIRGPRR